MTRFDESVGRAISAVHGEAAQREKAARQFEESWERAGRTAADTVGRVVDEARSYLLLNVPQDLGIEFERYGDVRHRYLGREWGWYLGNDPAAPGRRAHVFVHIDGRIRVGELNGWPEWDERSIVVGRYTGADRVSLTGESIQPVDPRPDEGWSERVVALSCWGSDNPLRRQLPLRDEKGQVVEGEAALYYDADGVVWFGWQVYRNWGDPERHWFPFEEWLVGMVARRQMELDAQPG